MNRIRGLTNQPTAKTSSQGVLELARRMQGEIDALTADLRDLLDHPSRSEEMDFLKNIKGAILALAETSNLINRE